MHILWSLALLGTTALDARESCLVQPPRDAHVVVNDSLPIIEELVQLLRSHNPELRTLQSRLAETRARHAASGGVPAVVLSGEIEEVPGVAVGRSGSLRVDVQRAFRTGARQRAERAVVHADITHAEAARDAGELAFIARVTVLVETLVGRTRIATRLRAEAQLLDDVGAGLTARFAVGDARYVDVLRLRAERLGVMNEVARVTSHARSARTMLLGMAGDDSAVVQTLSVRLDTLVHRTTSEKNEEYAIPAPPDLARAMALSFAIRSGSAEEERSAALAALGAELRKPVVTGSIGLQRFGDVGTPAPDRRIGVTVGASLPLPFTVRAANRRAAAANAARLTAAASATSATRASTRTHLVVANDRYSAARERMAAYDLTLLRGAREERAGALQAYRTGAVTLLELLDFERALVHAETGRVNARLDAVSAYANVIALITSPDTPPALSMDLSSGDMN
jgi:outer membrane protein TolC